MVRRPSNPAEESPAPSAIDEVWRGLAELSSTQDPEELAARFLRLGIQMEGLEDFASACEFYSKGLSLDPQSAHTRYFLNNNIGYSLNQLRRFADAEPYCRTAIEVEGRRHNAYKNLGVSLTGQKRYAEASVCFVQATRACPGDRRALLCLERLVTEVPEILSLVPGLEKDLDECRVLGHMGSSPSRN